jgi:hypothetical protein
MWIQVRFIAVGFFSLTALSLVFFQVHEIALAAIDMYRDSKRTQL